MMRRGRVADADAAAQQDRHLEPAAAHVLHLRYLVDDFADRVQDEVDEHEVDDGPRPRHGGPAGEADEATLGDGRVAEALGTVEFVQSRRRAEVAALLADAL